MKNTRSTSTVGRGILALAMALGLAVSCLAFEKDMPKDKAFGPEQSQTQVAQQQALQGRVKPVGDTEVTPNTANPGVAKSEDVGGSFATAASAQASNSFKNAGKEIAESKNAPNYFGLLMMLIGVLVLAAIGFKNYTDKAIPLPKSMR